MYIIGASVSEPHTSDVYSDLYIYIYIYYGTYVAPYIQILHLLAIILNSAMLQFVIWCIFVSFVST